MNRKSQSHLLLDFLGGCNSGALSSSTTEVLVVLLDDLLALVVSDTVTSGSEVSALVFFLVFFLVALVVLRGSAKVSSSTDLSARDRARVALVDLSGWETVWSAWSSSSFLARPFLPLVLPGV